jgi:hypothetical protein
VVPDWFYDLAMGDWSINLLLAQQGPLALVGNEALSTYRLHNSSFWLTRPLLDRTQDELKALRTFAQHLDGKCAAEIGHQINRRQFWLVDADVEAGTFAAARQTFCEAFSGWWRHRGVTFPWVIRYGLRAYTPWFIAIRRFTRS